MASREKKKPAKTGKKAPTKKKKSPEFDVEIEDFDIGDIEGEMSEDTDMSELDDEVEPSKKGSSQGAKTLSERKDVLRLVNKAKAKGTISIDEINDALGPDIGKMDELENVIAMLVEAEVEFVEEGSRSSTDSSDKGDADDFLSDSESESSSDTDDFAKGNDPVRLYLRKMGSVNLLTRDGEVEIAKRIEEGESEILDAVLGTQICLSEILDLGDRLKKGKIRVKEIVKENEPGEDGQTIEFDEPKVTERALNIIMELGILREALISQMALRKTADKEGRAGKVMEHDERIAELQAEIILLLRDLKINRRQIDRIVQRIKVLVRRINKVEFELAPSI